MRALRSLTRREVSRSEDNEAREAVWAVVNAWRVVERVESCEERDSRVGWEEAECVFVDLGLVGERGSL